MSTWSLPSEFSTDAFAGSKIGRSGLIEGTVLDTDNGVFATSEITYDGTELSGALVTVEFDSISYILEVTSGELGLDQVPDDAAIAAFTESIDCGETRAKIISGTVTLVVGTAIAAGIVYAAITYVPAGLVIRSVATGISRAFPTGGYRTVAKSVVSGFIGFIAEGQKTAVDLYYDVRNYNQQC